ncbi:MAG: hypothetical protein A2912_01515 [Candidatus Buchananbacteria bacterium RIFCSPLOWO2_01_FULL_40_23b]|uniref:Polymerase beta nucleotidyltransferase domain-containing protein n=1 Tax=Candidatus Buchananbacteria bacterium RIFCSPLOWO2_01_FULL_40_23b TaxID=1797544 RepID=A0A1G1YSY2_9BACT|nr:MAG: hypothetical protein A2912_01515 [Candidatus Buchananbacteria bacterium RIFCSPLOWO2_01_FULL_40_23b]
MQQLAKVIVPILKKNDITKAGIFGSYARGEQKKKSDIDILIKFKGKKSMFDLVHVELELKKKIGKKVDLVTYNSLHRLLKERILHDEVRIL